MLTCVRLVVDYADKRFLLIYSQKGNFFAKPLLPVHMGPRVFFMKKDKKSCDTVPLQKDRLESFRHSCRNTDKDNNYKFQVFLVVCSNTYMYKYNMYLEGIRVFPKINNNKNSYLYLL